MKRFTDFAINSDFFEMKCFEAPISLRKHLFKLSKTFKIGIQIAIFDNLDFQQCNRVVIHWSLLWRRPLLMYSRDSICLQLFGKVMIHLQFWRLLAAHWTNNRTKLAKFLEYLYSNTLNHTCKPSAITVSLIESFCGSAITGAIFNNARPAKKSFFLVLEPIKS